MDHPESIVLPAGGPAHHGSADAARRRGARTAAAALAIAVVGVAGPRFSAGASTPSSGVLAMPSSGSVSLHWSGTIRPGGGNAGGLISLRCIPGNPTDDDFRLTVQVPSGFYATHSAELSVRIDWTPVVSPAANDLGLTTAHDDGSGNLDGFQDSHQVATTFEQVSVPDPTASGFYHAGVCADTNATPQAYSATATLQVLPPPPAAGTGTVAFAPATIVDASFLGGEPQLTLERPISGALPGATTAERAFVDWPLSTRTNTGMLHRSLNGGDSFRPLLDLQCALRNRPNCLTGGGGDTVNRVNLYDGTVYFGDQEAVVNEALASSLDHGDSFPDTRQFAVSNAATGVDRQWIATVNAPGVMGGPVPVEVRGFYSYHVPLVGEYIQGIDTSGRPIPQPAPQLTLVSQSGPSRVDTTGGPGNHYVYQSYRDGNGFHVAAAPIARYQDPTAWTVSTVSTDQPAIFPWINLDSRGNLYAVWVTGGSVYYSTSSIADPANNPHLGGTPAHRWTPQVRINAAGVNSTVFPEVVAGDPGRVAILYDGTRDYSGQSDGAPPTARWNAYVAISTNGLSTSGLSFTTGVVNHRVLHRGSVCTSGTACTGDRSLLDMIDLQMDSAGRVGVVFTDNNSTFGDQTGSASAKGNPFVHFAKLTAGPSLRAGHAAIDVTVPQGFRSAPAGDATWPNTASGANLPSLDELGAGLMLQGNQLVGRIVLADTSKSGRLRDIAAYNAVPQVGGPAQRLLYVLRFSTAGDIYYMAFEQNADGTTRSLGGRLDAHDGITNGTSVLAAGYHTDPGFTVHSSLNSSSLVLSGSQAEFGVAPGTHVYSVSAFAMAGPSEADELTILDVMRTIDATPPFDATLSTSVTG